MAAASTTIVKVKADVSEFQDALRGLAVVRPGDKLVVGVNEGMDPDSLQRVTDELSGGLGCEVLIVAGATSMAVVTPS